MPSLKDLVEYQKDLLLPGGKILTVSGLTLETVGSLVNDYKEEFDMLLQQQKFNAEELLSKYAVFCATLIAYSTGNPSEVNYAKKLPVGIQIKALEAIWDLSAVDTEQVGKLAVRLLAGVKELQPFLGLIASAKLPATSLAGDNPSSKLQS